MLPELLTLFIVFYGAQILIRQIAGVFVDQPRIEINSFVAGMFALGLVFSSYASEAFVSAFKGIPSGQYEGGFAVGLTRFQTMRLVILPQLIRLALPGPSWSRAAVKSPTTETTTRTSKPPRIRSIHFISVASSS